MIRKRRSNRSVIEDRGCHPGVGVARMTAAGAAIKAGPVGIIRRLTAVTTEQHEPGEVIRQAHVPQRAEGQLDAVLQIDAGGIRAIPRDLRSVRMIVRRMFASGGEGVVKDFCAEQQAGGFDEREA
jgi:hypothetical protein